MAGALVRKMYLDGLRQWPLVELSFEAFERHCSALLGDHDEDTSREGADLFLCCACAEGNAEAQRTFERETLDVARAAIENVRRDRDFADDTLQDVWDKLLCGSTARVAKYTGRGALKAWVRVTATRAALDRCRALGLATSRHAELTDRIAATQPNVELSLSRARYANLFQAALRESVAALPARERNALRMHVCDGCSIDVVGRAYGVHRATAARWLERARQAIADGVRSALSLRNMKLTDSEFRSLGQGMASELELRLSSTFARPPATSSASPLSKDRHPR